MHKKYSESMTNAPLVKAVIYARYSSHSQREESIEGQLRRCYEYAEQNGFTVVGEYIDRAITGKTDDRADFQRLIKDSENHNFTVVLVYALDRFARNRYDSAFYKRQLKKNGVKVYSATQQISEAPEGILLESMLEGLAEYYSENLSQNIKRGITENALQCKYSGGTVTLGYKINQNQMYEIDPVGAKAVEDIFNMYADGVKACDIVTFCKEQGYKTATGNPIDYNAVARIIRNEKYIGTYRVNDIVVENGIPAIVSRELFERVQAMIKHNYGRRARGKSNTDFLLTTKLFCGHCGEAMRGESGTSQNGTMYYYYKCATKKKGGKCDKKQEHKDVIEKLVVEHTVKKVLTDENIEMIAEKAMELINKEAADNSLLEQYQAQFKDTEKRINNILDMLEQGIVTDSTKSRLVELESLKKDLICNIAREKNKKPFLNKERIAYWLNSFKYGDVDDIDFRRRVIDTLVNAVYVYDTDGGKGRKFVITFNLSNDNTTTFNISDLNVRIQNSKLHQVSAIRTEFFFIDANLFGCIMEIEDIG